MPSLRPFFTYYGGKWRAAPRYPSPIYERLVEPFAGSAGYAVRHHERLVELRDLDPVIIGLWRYLIAVKSSEVRRLPLVFDDVRNLSIPQEAKWLIGFWLNKGMTSPCNIPGKWMRDNDASRLETYWGAAVRDRIATQVEKIRHWRATLGSYDEVSTSLPATWYVDPPYRSESGRRYRSSEIDYAHLSRWCKALKGQVMVCEQQGADWLPFKPYMAIKTTEGKYGKSRSHEALWTNGGPDTLFPRA